MEESIEETMRREETLRIYHSTKEALRIIGDVARDTLSDSTSSSSSSSYSSSYGGGGRGGYEPPRSTYDSLPAPTVYNKYDLLFLFLSVYYVLKMLICWI